MPNRSPPTRRPKRATGSSSWSTTPNAGPSPICASFCKIHSGAGLAPRCASCCSPARPGEWWENLDTWIGDELDIPAELHPLPPLADQSRARAALFVQARDRFADHLGLPADRAARIGPPLDLDTEDDYAQVLTIHIAALAAVDAALRGEAAPTNPARASAYLLKRERAHWSALHQRASQPLSTSPEAMGRTVRTATLTRPLARSHGWSALRQVGLADSTAAANTLLDDHRYCYPASYTDPARTVTVLEPLYPDRLGEDFLGLSTPARPDDPGGPHPVPGAATDDWAHEAAHRLLATEDPGVPTPWTRDALAVLIETARRWPHVATGQLYPLLKARPELALHAGGTALARLAGLDTLDLTVLEAIEPHLPAGRHTDLDVGIAALTARLAHHRLAGTEDPLSRAHVYQNLATRRHYAGLRSEALTTGRDAVRAWHDLTRTHPGHAPNLAGALSNLGIGLSGVGRREEALAVTEEAVAIQRRLAAADAADYEPHLAGALTNLGARLLEVGRREEALAATEEAVAVYRRLAANAAVHEPDFAVSLSNLGALLAEVGRREEALAVSEEAVAVHRRLAAANAAAYAPDLAGALSNLGNRLSGVGRREEALAATEEAVAIYRRLAAANRAAHEPNLAGTLSNLGAFLLGEGRREEALAVIEEAVEVRRRLAALNSAAHSPDLANSLTILALLLASGGDLSGALSAVSAAGACYQRHVAAMPSLLPALRAVAGLQAQLLDALEKPQDAAAVRRWLRENPLPSDSCE
ncbi:tetratricopeptide repeat protein [Streptomyces sp. NPDC101132]|uniref:tetratricopeptide repeat protein n=1 Tax=Streptomyces sp. NPDC101132 TaxID=3366110 RepID=UPI00382857FF